MSASGNEDMATESWRSKSCSVSGGTSAIIEKSRSRGFLTRGFEVSAKTTMPYKPSSGILRLVRPDILAMLGYEPIEPIDVLAERLGISADRVAKLDANENPYGPSPRVLELLGSYDSYHRYPDPGQRKLREALAGYAGVGAEHIVAGHGSDEIIDLLLRAVLAPGDAAIDCPPTFGMYGFSTRVAGGRTIDVPRRDDFTIDIGRIEQVAKGAPNETKIVLVASPNNPTGNPLRRDELDALLATGLLVVVDEAYVEFAGGSFATLVPERENLVVLRTFSKWAGLAGLRAGYGIMPPTLADVLMHIKQPYTPNVAAEVAMLASLEDKAGLMKGVQAIVQERERMVGKLKQLEFFEVYPSDANFVLCRLDGLDASATRDRLAQRGIFVRHFDTPRLRQCIRISVGLPEHTDRLIAALSEQGGSGA
jgi:histidinol-phosphate aminotransferase